jgi:hypothetical protein
MRSASITHSSGKRSQAAASASATAGVSAPIYAS